jgi:hypothetical protein
MLVPIPEVTAVPVALRRAAACAHPCTHAHAAQTLFACALLNLQ